MSAFAIGAALLALLAALFVAWPLRRAVEPPSVDADRRRADNIAAWRQATAELEQQLAEARIDADEHRLARNELDRRLLADAGDDARATVRDGGSRLLFGLALGVPLAAIVLYAVLGALGPVQLDRELRALEGVSDPAERSARLVELMPRLESVARARDEDGNYRYLLAGSYSTLGRHAEAAAMYGELVELYPQDAGLMAQQAQALYLAADRQLTPAVQALVDRALLIDPKQVTLLGMVGMDRFQSGDYAGAVSAWEKLLAQLPADAPDAAVIRDGIAMARERAGMPAAADEAPLAGAHVQAGAQAATPSDAVETPSLRVAVRLADGMQVPEGATAFVFARAVGGPPMPLAVARFPAAELPREVRLDDTMAMAPGMSLSRFAEVTVTARITQSGTVKPEAGDLEGDGGKVSLRPGEQALEIVIDRQL